MKTKDMPIDAIRPYDKNPRKNERAVDAVAASIKEFGFKQPIVVDRNNVIIVGHTRWKAAQRLGMDTVPVLKADDLTEEQARAYRLADNKTNELADWNFDLLGYEIADLSDFDLSQFGFNADQIPDGSDFFDREDRNDTSREEGNEEYNEFLDKFEAKKTTDDCYTPEIVYDAICGWVENEYGLNRKDFLRPFYPGGDYQKFVYPKGGVVVDNPPFSILAEILRWYDEHKIRFFMFAPSLTVFSSSSSSTAAALVCGGKITYENGAVVPTSFVTNLEDCRARSVPDLYRVVEEADAENKKQFKKVLPKYKYPAEVLSAAMLRYLSEHDTPLRISRKDSHFIRILDSQREAGNNGIFGSGYLLSEKAAAEKAAAEKANATEWELSDREREIIRSLGD